MWSAHGVGAHRKRLAERNSPGESYQEPPRTTCPGPASGPLGLCIGLRLLYFSATAAPSRARPALGLRLLYSSASYQSAHHSQTLPCRSCNPKRLGGNLPTGAVKAYPSSSFQVAFQTLIAFSAARS